MQFEKLSLLFPLLFGMQNFFPVVSRPLSREYDIGCYRARNGNISITAITSASLPVCLEGGLWRKYQCSLNSCNCVYVDTGRPVQMEGQHRRIWSPQKLEQTCTVRTEKRSDGCNAPSLTYPCSLARVKYVYDNKTKQCIPKTGCYGFESYNECRNSCHSLNEDLQQTDKCRFPKELGKYCRTKEATRYWHDSSSGKCIQFQYRGCGGNQNNFPSLWECKKACELRENVSTQVRVDMYLHYNITVARWVVQKYKLSLTDPNRLTLTAFAEILPHVVAIRQAYSTTITDSQNGNVLDSIEERRRVKSPQVVCYQSVKNQPCRALLQRWYFDPVQKKCFEFIYGGCRGNENNFKTRQACLDYCSGILPPSIISLDVGAVPNKIEPETQTVERNLEV